MAAAINDGVLLGCYLLAATKDGGRKHEQNVSDDSRAGPRDCNVWVDRLKEEYLSLIQVRFTLKQRHDWG